MIRGQRETTFLEQSEACMPLLPNSKGKLRWFVHLRVTFKEPISTTISVIPSYCRHTSSLCIVAVVVKLCFSAQCELLWEPLVAHRTLTPGDSTTLDSERIHKGENSQGGCCRVFPPRKTSQGAQTNVPCCIICMIVGKARTGKHIDPGDSLIPFKPALGERGPVGLCPSLAGIKFLMAQHSGDAPN